MLNGKGHIAIVAKAADGVPEIMVYGDITSDMAAWFAHELKELENTAPLINVRINSEGGSVYHGIAMFNLVRQSPCAIDMYIDGICASMASALAMAGRKVYIGKYACLMTHKPSGGAWGSAEELRNIAEQIDACERVVTDMYMARTGLSEEAVRATFLNGKDTYFDADAAVKAKLVDGIYDSEPIDMPAKANARAIFDAHQAVLVAKLDRSTLNSNINMRQISASLWAQMCAAIGIVDSADDTAVMTAFKKISDKAQSYDNVKASLDTAKAELKELKNSIVADKVKALLDEAANAGKVTAALRTKLEADYASNPDGLKEILAHMKPYTPITDRLQEGDEPAEYKGKTWDELMEAGKISEVKAQAPDYYKKLFKKTFGKDAE